MSQKENKLILYKDNEGKLSVNTLFADEDVWRILKTSLKIRN